MTRALNPVEKNPQRVTKELRRQSEELNWDGIGFLTPCSERVFKKFEKNNDISLLVFGHEVTVNKTYINPLYIPTDRREKAVRLFFLKNEDGTASHYCVMKNMSALVGAQVSAEKEKKYVCDFCLNVFGSQTLLDDHVEYCLKHDAVNAIMPKPARSILKFKNIQNSVECPIKICADFESFLEPIDRKHGKTQLYQVKNLYRPSFKHTGKYFRGKELDLMLRKGVYPYEYMTGVQRFCEKSLPPKEEFASLLGTGVIFDSDTIALSHISDEDYQHAQKVFEALGCENLADYTKLYCKSDVLLLADVFESFIDVCLEKYKLDPSHYITAPSLSWDAMLKMTDVKLKPLTDSDMHLFFEEGTRGGVSMITNRYSKANHKYMENFNPEEGTSFIQYLDANNLYGWAMGQPLPVGNFMWLSQDEIETFMKYPEWIRSCTLEVDLEYLHDFHDLHNNYPLAPETVTVNDTPKLIPNLGNRKKYVLHYKNLQQYLKYGMKITKIHRASDTPRTNS